MFLKEIKKSRGQAAKVILIVAIIVVIALGIAFFVMRKNTKTPVKTSADLNLPPPPVYDLTEGTVRFLSISAIDEGNVLYGTASKYPRYQADLKTTERFIKVTVGAQNIGKIDTKRSDWDLGSVIDSEGRIYGAIDANNWILNQNYCGTVLKPSFQPVFCVRYYEVARVAKGLKIQVRDKAQSGVIDLRLSGAAPIN